MEVSERKKPLLCRLGWHTSTFLDCAAFACARRCNKCGDYVNKLDGDALERERAMWAKRRGSCERP